MTILNTAAAIGPDALTPKWEATLRAFYGLPLRAVDVEHLRAATRRTDPRTLIGRPKRELWARVGRRGRKSSTAALIAVHECMFGEHEKFLMLGERGLIAAISKDAAGSALIARFAELHAHALGVKTNWTSIGNIRVLELEGLSLGIAVFACSAKAPRGWAMPVVIADEIAFWATDDDFVNVDSEILAAVKPGMAQFPDAKFIGISSPFGRDGLHYDTVEANLGDDAVAAGTADPDVLAVEGPTWHWNPEISEAATRKLERDSRIWSREYAAIPGETVSGAFDTSAVIACFEPREPKGARVEGWVALDPSSLRHDGFAMLAGYRTDAGEFVIDTATEWSAEHIAGLGFDGLRAIVTAIVNVARDHGAIRIFSDQREEAALRTLFEQDAIELVSFAWSERSKDDACTALRRLFTERKIVVLPTAPTEMAERLRSELLRVRVRLTPGGNILYATGGLDLASALITLAHAINHGEMLGGNLLLDALLRDADAGSALDQLTLALGASLGPTHHRAVVRW